MSSAITREDLEAHGLGESSIVREASKTIVRGGESLQGFQRSGDSDLDALSSYTTALQCEPASALGFRIETFDEVPSVLNISTPRDDIRLVGGLSESSVRWDENVEVRFDIQKADGPVFLVDSRGEGLGLRLEDEDNLYVCQLLTVQGPSDRRLELSSGLEQSIEQSNDTWLNAEVRSRLETESAWEHVVAVGLFGRLRHDEAGGGSQSIPDAVLNGEALSSEHFIETTWARMLDDDVLDTIVQMGASSMTTLREDMSALLEQFDDDDTSVSRREIVDVLHHRDDLECVHYLLQATDRGDALRGTGLARLDRLGNELADAVEEQFDPFDDERLERAISSTPHGWWVRPAAR